MGDVTTQTRTLAPGPDGPRPDDEKRTFLGLSLSQIAGSALAAVTAAVAASFLGVAGTLIGAAFGSVVSTIAGAAYATSLQTAASRVRTTRTVLVRPGPDGVRGASQTDPARVPSGFGAAPVTLGATTYRSAGARRRQVLERVRWKPVAAVAALGFVLGVGLLTVGEGVLGHPVSSSAPGGTTLGDAVGGSSRSTPTPSPTPSSASPTDPATATPSATTSPDAPATATPSDGGTGGSTATGTPTDAATTTADPAPSAPADAATSAPAAGTAQTP